MSEYSCRIERVSNGYTVRVDDPKIRAANRKPGRTGEWKDPTREFAFKNIKEVLGFLEKNLDKALPADDFETSFDLASAAEDDNDGDE